MEPQVTFASRQRVCMMTTHTGTNQFVYLFAAEKQNTLKHALCLTASSLLQIGQFVHKTHFQSCAHIHKTDGSRDASSTLTK